MATIIIICAVLLIAFAVYRTIQKFRGKAKDSCCGGPEVKTVKKVDDTDESHYPYHYTLSIEGMHCSNCARTVENELNSMDGVWGRVNLGKNEASVLAKTERTREDFASVLSPKDYTVTGFAAAQQ
ncbi:MAG: heavy-metal-associated domain-containing protein [Firmicutes bacterium]|nr:heavy-metal-associated domain-containing protein [Bacillota bacterium]